MLRCGGRKEKPSSVVNLEHSCSEQLFWLMAVWEQCSNYPLKAVAHGLFVSASGAGWLVRMMGKTNSR